MILGKIMDIKKLATVMVAGSIFMSQSSMAALATNGIVYLSAHPQSWVGGGLGAPEVTWIHGVEGLLSAQENFDQGIQAAFNKGDSWTFDFAAPSYDSATNTDDGSPLHVGFYNNAKLLPFNSPTQPGMEISGAGRSDAAVTGWFNVLEVEYGPSEDITRFAVDFRQFDESSNMTGPSLYGSLRFNSSIPITPVPEPEAYAMLLAGLGIITIAVRRKNYRRVKA
jgi:hypothetical protein